MHIPTLFKKIVITFSGRLYLSDSVRNSVYRWAWEHIRELPPGASVVDIGSRDSLFPSFLAWRRYFVRSIERDSRFSRRQLINCRHWNVSFVIDNCDFLAATIPGKCDAICSLFSLQHSGDNDIVAYRSAARKLHTGGMFLSATEYRHGGTRFHLERDDGAMRIYGPEDIETRIEKPLFDEGMTEFDRVYIRISENRKKVFTVSEPHQASYIYLLFKKN